MKTVLFKADCIYTLLEVKVKVGGLVVGRRTCDLRVAGSSPGRDAAA